MSCANQIFACARKYKVSIWDRRCAQKDLLFAVGALLCTRQIRYEEVIDPADWYPRKQVDNHTVASILKCHSLEFRNVCSLVERSCLNASSDRDSFSSCLRTLPHSLQCVWTCKKLDEYFQNEEQVHRHVDFYGWGVLHKSRREST